MKVILLKDVRGVGQRGDVRDVADGYAMNALFPKQLAEPATPEKIKQLEAGRQAQEAQLQQAEAELTRKIEMLRGKKITIPARATEKGGLFKAVAPKDIAKALLAEHSLDIPEGAIELPQPIKTLGEHIATLSSKTKKADIGVTVAAA